MALLAAIPQLPPAEPDAAPVFRLRGVEPADLKFIRSSWLESYAESSLAHTLVPPLYRLRWGAIIDALIERSQIVVACDAESPGVVWGWLCWESLALDPPRIRHPAVAHYAYVKDGARKQGVLRALTTHLRLTANGGFYYSHSTASLKTILHKQEITPHPIYDFTLAQ